MNRCLAAGLSAGVVRKLVQQLPDDCNDDLGWATQVLENLVKYGAPSRAEITDAAMSERAECVMLNKGPYIVEGVRLLDKVLTRMDGHQRKKTARLGVMNMTGESPASR